MMFVFMLFAMVCLGYGKGAEQSIKRSPHQSTVAFLAVYKGPTLHSTDKDIRIPYNDVRLNEGNGYNAKEHTFTAPVPGLYIFHVYGLSKGKYGCLKVLKNSQKEARGWGQGFNATIAQAAMLRLKKGDVVEVVLCRKKQEKEFSLHKGSYNTFTGHLVR